jgi:septum formation protein
VLASTSPRRRAILEQLRIPFELASPVYDEAPLPGLSARELIAAHASGKARSVTSGCQGRSILGVDTGVVLRDTLYGKPHDEADAARILTELAGETHVVVSAVCLHENGAETTRLVETRVRFRSLSASQIDQYVRAGEWGGLAGGYAIQGFGALLVAGIEGDYLNVVGLPASALVDVLGDRRPDLLALGA